jgi:Protein phosphatase 2C
MRVQTQAHWEPKAGSQDSEYEDAFWPLNAAQNMDVFVDEFCCAVADGATESSYSRIWAKQLVQAACHKRLFNHEAVLAHLPQMQRQWSMYVQQRLQRSRAALPWYVTEKAQQGAHAALLSFNLQGGVGGGTWHALAVGDCCLAQVRDGIAINLFPYVSSSEFNTHPYLLASQPTHNDVKQVSVHVHTLTGEWHSGDHFFLMTDALAQWFYRGIEQGEMPWSAFDDLDSNAPAFLSFREWMQVLRADGIIRNDDVTVMHIVVTGGDK